jgi:hypothetical protein
MLSNLAKSIELDMYAKVKEWEIKEFSPNYKSITDTIKFKRFSNYDIQIQMLNVFQNIKTLTLECCGFVENSG